MVESHAQRRFGHSHDIFAQPAVDDVGALGCLDVDKRKPLFGEPVEVDVSLIMGDIRAANGILAGRGVVGAVHPIGCQRKPGQQNTRGGQREQPSEAVGRRQPAHAKKMEALETSSDARK